MDEIMEIDDEIKSSFEVVFARAIFLDDFLYMPLHIIGSVRLS